MEELAQRVRPSLVSISVAGRDGGQLGLGTGFVVAPDGLIATNLHVIGEGHRFTVELADGTRLDARGVHASERRLDLVVVQVDVKDKPLTALPLGASASVPQGAAVVVMGNPLGLKHSVVSGVVSAKREINGSPMLQLAIPIEPGNSGGPVLDMQGRVLGIVNLKSTVNQNLGFAVEVDALKPLLARPNPIPLERWVTIGGMDGKRWQPLWGAQWRQRAGHILVRGSGTGFGGRSLCLYQAATPEPPFELAVQVRLNDESGAAGLVFHADGGDRHYGFYPSSGRLRLTCFDGPSVFQWQVLAERPSEHYRPGDWNRLMVRVAKDKLQCYVNEHLVMESADTTFTQGKVGLAKFRNTEAEFKQFQIARELMPGGMSTLPDGKLHDEIARLPNLAAMPPDRIEALAGAGEAAMELLRRRARELELRAGELQKLAGDVHVSKVASELARVVQDREQGFDLLRASLLIARLDEQDIDVDGYVQEVDRMAAEIAATLDKDADDESKLAALNNYLFRENGFHGSRFDYYQRANSYLNRVIDDRAGLPLTLSILYLELGSRLGLAMEGVGLPSHFVVRYLPARGEPRLIDVFDQGTPLTREDAARIVRDNGGIELREEHLQASTRRMILTRMLSNLRVNAERERDIEALLRYCDASLALDPGSVEERLRRASLRGQTGRLAACLADLDWIIERRPPEVNLEAVRAFRDRLQREQP